MDEEQKGPLPFAPPGGDPFAGNTPQGGDETEGNQKQLGTPVRYTTRLSSDLFRGKSFNLSIKWKKKDKIYLLYNFVFSVFFLLRNSSLN